MISIVRIFALAVATTVVVLAMAGPSSAQHHEHSDVHLHVELGELHAEPPVVEGHFGDGIDLPLYRAVNPGFGFHASQAGVTLDFDLLPIDIDTTARNLWYWDGAGSVAFGPSPHDLRVSHPTVPPSVVQVAPADSARIPGFDIGTSVETSPGSGEFEVHQHLWFDLVDSSGTPIAAPDDGVYLWATDFGVSTPGVDPSEPVLWVMGRGVEETVHEAAHEWVESHVVPEPTTLTLTAVAVALLLTTTGRRRRGGPACAKA